MANNLGQHRLQIPVFNPDNDDISAKAWMNLVDLGKQAAGKTGGVDNWSDEVTASMSIMLLKGKAADWVANLIEEGDPAVKKWSELKKKFQERFCVKHTLSEKTRLLSGLQMTHSETCADFFDRVKSALNILYDEMWTPPEEINAEADKLARTKSINMHHKLLFSAGLRSDIRQDVIIQDSVTLEDVKTVAMRVEASVKDRKKSAAVVEVSEVLEEEEKDDSEFEVDAIHKQSQRQVRQYQNRGGRGSRSFRGGTYNRGRGGRFNGLCHYCSKAGHQIRSCFARQNDEKQGIFRDRRPPSDRPQETAAVDASVEVNALDVSEYLNAFQV